MRKIFVWIILGFNILFTNAQDKNNPVVMTIAGKDILLSEFLFLAQKDSSVDLLNKQSLNTYTELFKNFKLKVAEAESKRYQESLRFNEELESYKTQLRDNYLSDKEGESNAIKKVYDRGEELVAVSHILFRFPTETRAIVSKDTVELYRKANEVYRRIAGGEDFEAVGKDLAKNDSLATYENVGYIHVLQTAKPFENAAFALQRAGDISKPVRTDFGFHIVRLNERITDPGKIKVAHILVAPQENPSDPKDNEDEVLQKRANDLYERAVKGEDFAYLAGTYSSDLNTIGNGGELPYFGLGEMVDLFEQAAFALKDTGDIARPIKTRYGYHIIKLLNRRKRFPFEEAEQSLYTTMRRGEWNFELYHAFEEREKAKFGYVFYPEAYAELQQLCDDYHPEDTTFYNRARELAKPLMMLNGTTFPQNEFIEYLKLYPLSAKRYSGDFLYDVYRQFVRTIVTELEKRMLEDLHPEFNQLVKEYYDGILLFDISSERVWNKPVEEQAELEAKWIEELNKKYEIKLNRKVLNNLKKYIK